MVGNVYHYSNDNDHFYREVGQIGNESGKAGRRIAVIGSPGAGKSWFCKRLGAVLGIPVHHLDMIHWSSGWVAMDRDRFLERQREIVAGVAWIIDGNYTDSMDIRIEGADTVIFLDINRLWCIGNATWRLLSSRWVERSDMSEGCEERLNAEFIRFLRFIWKYPERSRPRIWDKLQKAARSKTVIVLSSRREVIGYLKEQAAVS